MKNANANRKIVVSILAMMLLIYGVQNFSYGQMAPPVVEASDDDFKHKHDGFYFNVTSGFGITAFDDSSSRFSYPYGTFRVGYAVVENLIPNLTMEINQTEINIFYGDPVAGFTILPDAKFTILNTGIGVTYYIMPTNVYLTGSIGPAIGGVGLVGAEPPPIEAATGYGINVAIGKEWWVKDNRGIGIAGQLSHVVLDGSKVNSFGILFSATFN